MFDPKLAGLLSELELGLGSVVRQSGAQPSKRRGNSEEEVLGKREEGRENKLNVYHTFSMKIIKFNKHIFI